MTLRDCYDMYMRKWGYKGLALTRRTENEAISLKPLLLGKGNQPLSNDLEQAKDFLVDVEYWKADCLQDKTGLARMNSGVEVWHALVGAVSAVDDLEALH